MQGRGRRAVLVLQRVQRVEQPCVGRVVAAEQVLARRAGGDQPHAEVRDLDQRQRVDQRLQRALEAPGGGQGAGQRDEQGEAPRRVAGDRDRRVGDRRPEQAQRGLEPAGGDGGGARRDLVAGLLEHGGGGLVAGAGRALDVVGARGQRGRAVGERVGGAGVRLQPPRLAGPVVDGAPHERMAEAVAAGDVGRAGDVGGQQGIDGGQGLALVEPGGGGREVEVERLAGDGGAPPEAPGGLAQPRDLLAERGGHGGRDPDGVRLGVRHGGRCGSPGQLLEVERVAAALAVEQRERALAEQGVGLGLRERTETDLGDHPVAAGGLQRREQAVRDLAGAEGERDQHRRHGRAAQQVGDQLERGVVGPLHVVEDEHDRVAHGHPLEQGAHRAVGVEALVLQPARPRGGGGGEDAGQLADAVADQGLQATLAEARDVVVEGIDPGGERELALQLCAAAHEHRMAPLPRPFGELAEQPRLADPRLAADHEPAGASAADSVERGVDGRQLLATPDEPLLLRLRYRRHWPRR